MIDVHAGVVASKPAPNREKLPVAVLPVLSEVMTPFVRPTSPTTKSSRFTLITPQLSQTIPNGLTINRSALLPATSMKPLSLEAAVLKTWFKTTDAGLTNVGLPTISAESLVTAVTL